MKKNHITISTILLAAVTMLSSCQTSGQAAAGLTGAAIGSTLGSAIGGATGGHYGRYGYYHYNGQGAALGSLIGMGVGAALGVAIQKSAEENERRQYENYQEYDSYEQNSNYSRNYSNNNYTPAPSRLPVLISEVTYFDGNGDGFMSKGETLEVETYIENRSNSTLYSVDIVLDTQQSKYVIASSPLTITLEPRQKVRYSGRIYCRKAKNGRSVPLTITVSEGNQMAQSETINLYMK